MKRQTWTAVLGLTALCAVLGTASCETEDPAVRPGEASPALPQDETARAEAKVKATVRQAEQVLQAPSTQASRRAAVGQPAPQFALKDLENNEVKLSDFKGKVVVLEWFNPGCPFVRLSHTAGSLKGLAKKHAEGGNVVWLAINSGAAGKQGHDVDENRAKAREWGIDYPVLRDESGSVGKAYGATNTPHLFVIDAEGVLRYSGAIDNSPDGEGKSPRGGKLVNYANQALDELSQGKPVSVPTTKAYGCGVKYGA